MEKIIYNTKLKKIVVGILVIMLMLYSMAPIASALILGYDPRQFYPDGLPDNADEINEWNYEDYDLVWSNGFNGVYDINKYAIESGGMDMYSLQQAVTQYNTQLKKAHEDGMSLGEAVDFAAGEAVEKSDEILGEMGQLVKEGDEDFADLGGILLSPVFYLINFIADAIISNLGNIMLGESGTFGTVTGTTVLQASPVSSIEGKSSYYTIEPDLDNVVGMIQYPNIRYTSEEIFAGKIDLLSIDFISGKNYEGNANQNTGWNNVRKLVSEWYTVLRMVAIIGLLSVLIYTGIKIIISANAKDKAKYKEWIINWVMAVAILFAMHLIMAFIISVTGEFSKLINDTSEGIRIGGVGNGTATNLMGYVRFMVQSEDFYKKVAYEVMYIALIVYTIKFTLVYLKRVLNMAFLTLISPIVALTYPIDKINDGRAQGFDMWLKEYIFNALLQPMHQLLYYILVGSAVQIAATNPIYGIVVLAFMTEAEKLLKKIFGFDKAGGGTVGGMAGAFAAGAIASNIGKIAKLAGGKGGKGGSGNTDKEKSLYDNPKPTEKDSGDDLFDFQNEEVAAIGGASAANAYQNSQNPVEDAERERLEEQLTDGQISKEELTAAQKTLLGIQEPKNPKEEQKDKDVDNSDNSDDGQSKKEKSKFAKGMGSVGKKLLKPVWDLDHGAAYNGKRLTRKVGKAVLGTGLGIGAAAVQAGISITDGKYNPAEGFAALAAGYAGAGSIFKGAEGIYNTYQEGTLSDIPEERKKEIMERAQNKWAERDDVIQHNKNKYKSEDRKAVTDIQKQLLAQGVTDIKEMDDCIKYIKANNNKSVQNVTPEMIKKARVMHDFTGDSSVQKVMYDPSKRKDYINTVAKDDRERRILENKFNEAVKYNSIVNN